MKKLILHTFMLCLALLLCISALAGCDDTKTEETQPDTTAEETAGPSASVINIAGGDNKYVIIRPDEYTETQLSLAKTLQSAIKSKTGAELEIKSDIIAPKAGYSESPYEIILGNCNRQASSDVFSTLKYNDYEIRISGTQLVICGGCDEALERAVTRFRSDFLTSDGVLAGDMLARVEAEYRVSSITVNGKDISEYTIVYSAAKKSVYESAIELINSRLQSLSGQTLAVVSSGKTYEANMTIQFGDCRTDLTSGITVADLEYKTLVSDGNLAFACALSTGAYNYVSSILDKYLPESSTGEIAITLENKTEEGTLEFGSQLCAGANLRLMTSNILGDSTLASRLTYLARVYLEYCPDFIGLQEANAVGHSGLLKQVGSVYAMTCETIGSTTGNCYTPILYKKDKYKVIESGSALFDARWTESTTKTYAWAVFEDIETGKKIAIINAHWAIILSSYDTEKVLGKKVTDSVEGKEWRLSNSKQILAKKDELRTKYGSDLAVAVMGDMNDYLTAESVKILGNTMVNCLDAATVSSSKGIGTFHSNPGQAQTITKPIDNIFVTGDVVKVYTHLIINTETSINSSDHLQVVVDVAY